ncbi:MAG: ribonuclease HI [Spirochaetes bacterium]|nr:ribonuclease HI [Spirochaetota bacterium]
MGTVIIHTDGGCRGNPGKGAWAAIIHDTTGGMKLEIGGSAPHTTNNKMELLAAIEALARLTEPCAVTLISDSTYLVKGMTEWITGWVRRGWKKSDKKPVENRDLWERLIELSKPHRMSWQWVRGHASNPGNERCDVIVNELMDRAHGSSIVRHERQVQ